MDKTISVSVSEKDENKKLKKKWNWVPYALIAPALFMIFAFLLYPMLNVFYYSFQHFDIAAPFYDGFAGLDNYIQIFTNDDLFLPSLWNSAKWVVVQVVLQLTFGMIFALLLNQTFKLRGLVRTIAFIPWALSGVLTSVIWMLMYNEHMGVFNDLLMRIGLIDGPRAFLASTGSAFTAVVIAELWRGIPFFAVTLLAGLQNIPTELYEAAQIDGASRIQQFVYITLPQLKRTIVLTTLLRTVWEFNNVDLLYNLTGGGPSNSTLTYSMYMTNTAVNGTNFGYGSALAVIAFVLLAVLAVIYLRLSRFEEE